MIMTSGKRPFSHIAVAILCLSSSLACGVAVAAGSLLDNALDQVGAAGTSTYSVTGNVDTNCVLSTASSSICVGTFIWTDDHSNDQSSNKGALVMSGNVQENLVSNINIDSAVAPVSASANIVSNVYPTPGSTINLSNSANSTGFLGGY